MKQTQRNPRVALAGLGLTALLVAPLVTPLTPMGDAFITRVAHAATRARVGRAAWDDLEPNLRSKFVPVLSGGNGVRIGMAQVTGPEADVNDVKAVAELETEWKHAARARLYIPISDLNVLKGINRVPRVGVSGMADVRLKF